MSLLRQKKWKFVKKMLYIENVCIFSHMLGPIKGTKHKKNLFEYISLRSITTRMYANTFIHWICYSIPEIYNLNSCANVREIKLNFFAASRIMSIILNKIHYSTITLNVSHRTQVSIQKISARHFYCRGGTTLVT